MKRLIYIGLGATLLCSSAYAQNEVDVLRYSQTTFGGTARSISMGGSLGAAGADFSTLSTNPGGLGVYRTSEMTFTPTLLTQGSTTDYLGSSSIAANKYNFYFNNAGLVYSYDNGDDNGWSKFNFGFGYNRLADFNSRMTYSGNNYNSSILDYFSYAANKGGIGANPYDADLAYGSKLIYNNSTNGTNYISDIDSARIKGRNPGVNQSRTVVNSGGMGEVNFAFGANYRDRLYIGASFNIVTLNYSQDVTYNEYDANGNIDYFNSLKYTQQLSTNGTGFNLKLGAIYRLADWVRIGAYYHTPTVLSLTDSYTSDLTAHFKSGPSDTIAYSPIGKFDYNITTPARQGISLAFFYNKVAMLTADIEHVNYAGATITATNSDDDSYYKSVNQTIANTYRDAYNIRTGLEYRVDKVLSLRGGVAYYQSPFKSGVLPSGVDANTMSYSGGLGIRGTSAFLDFAYVYSTQGSYFSQYYNPRPNGIQDYATTKSVTQNFLVTLGFKF